MRQNLSTALQPDFSSIENAFAKLKALLRRAAERTVGGLCEAVGRLVDLFISTECANYFASAGPRLEKSDGACGATGHCCIPAGNV